MLSIPRIVRPDPRDLVRENWVPRWTGYSPIH